MSIVGIDLGTTYSAIATLDDRGRPYTLPNRDGDLLTPSAVYLTANGEAIVGQPAMDVMMEHPGDVATLMKRKMGHPEFGRAVGGKHYRPESLSAVILRKLANDAESQIGPITGAVITVPAYFDDSRRKATMDAGKIAGLNVIDILDEPSAAALAYTIQTANTGAIPEGAPKTVIVYDLGGGTFDVTLVQLSKKKFRVLGIEGDVRLGGKDWDDRLVNHVADQFKQQFGADPRDDEQSMALLHAATERAKRTLSKVENATITCVHDGKRMSVPITREQFETLTRDLLIRTRLTTQQVVASAGLTWDRIDKVLMVGGSTHMPMTAKMLRDLTGRDADRSLAVSEVVARGAAAHAGIVTAKLANLAPQAGSAIADIVEVSVNAHSLGVEIRKGDDRINDKLILKNTQLPAAVSRVYFTNKDGQQKVRVRILQGEANQSAACIPIGDCWVDGLQEGMPKGAPVQVRCGVAANGRIEVMALDMTSGKMAKAEIHRTGGLEDADIQRESDWLKGLKIQ
jgi:molecular chaperone DnaK